MKNTKRRFPHASAKWPDERRVELEKGRGKREAAGPGQLGPVRRSAQPVRSTVVVTARLPDCKETHVSEFQLLDQVDSYFNIDGPHDSDKVIEAAQCASALIRYLNHATLPGARAAHVLEYASTIDSVLGGLAGVAHGQRQLLDQLARALQLQAAAPSLYDDRFNAAITPSTTAVAAAGNLHRTISLSHQLGTAIDDARVHTSHLGNKTDE